MDAAGGAVGEPGGVVGALRRALGPALLLFPAATWWAFGVGFYTVGLLRSDHRDYRAWEFGVSQFPAGLVRGVAYAGVPSVLVALLCIGGLVTSRGRGALVPVLLAFVSWTGLVMAVVATWTWISPDFVAWDG